VARHTFGTARRGFDPAEVRVFLEQIAHEMEAAADREEELRAAIAEAERRAANPVLDEATLTAALGQETARVLRSAHDAATELVTRAEADAARLRSHAEDEATQLHTRTEQNASDRIAQAEAVASDVRRRTQEEVASKLEGSKLEAEELVAQARAECRAMVQEAQEVRARVLADLTRRRRVLHSQIEQLRAGRERLAETINDVRHTVDRITDELFRAEDEARLAAGAAGRQAAAQEGPDDATSVAPSVDSPVAPAPEEIGTGALDEDETTRKQAVEELFARLRAEQGRGPQATTSPAGAGGQQTVDTVPDADVPPGTARPTPTSTTTSPTSPPAPPSSAGQSADADGIVVDPRLAERAEMLSPVVSTLVRRLKRALQDDQNDILDRVRAGGGWGPEVLPPTEDHEQRYVTAAIEHLRDAARSGATFTGGKPDDAPAVDDIADELAAAIVVPLRRRLDGAGGSVDAGDDSALIEYVGAAYRDWKGGRVERLAGDQTLAAFSQASLAAAPGASSWRWIVDDGGTQCPDCDDNALAGPLRRGEVFPTGHSCPPAHAGCRCLLAPAEA
jgi:DivIVA domain-containing protein